MLVKIVPVFLVLALVLSFAPAGAFANSHEVVFTLTVLHNNDAESQLIDSGGGLEDFGGAARFTTQVRRLKRKALAGKLYGQGTKRGVILVSSGDNFLAGPEFTASLDKGVPYYDTIAMDIMRYDAIAIGNHDFDFGPDVLANFIEGYRPRNAPTYLSANLDYSGEPRLQALFDDGRIAHSTVVEKNGEYIGIIGATTPNLPFISSPRNVVVFDNVAEIVQGEIDSLTATGVDKIVFISHLQNILEDIELAGMLEGLDVMVAGGGDEILANDGDLLIPGHEAQVFGPYPMIATDKNGVEIPVVTTAGEYGYVGRLVVGFNANGEVIEVNGNYSGPVRIAGGDNPDAVRANKRVKWLVTNPVSDFLADLASDIVADSEVALDGLRSSVRSMETNEGNLIADSQLWQATQLAADYGVNPPDVALQNGGGIRNNTVVPAGPLSALDTFGMVPFPNFVTVVENIPRAQFKEIMENAVACTQGADFAANPNCGSGHFAQVAGLSFEWSASGVGQILDGDGNVTTAGTRVQELVLDDGTVIVAGGVLQAGPDLNIAIVDFLARGGDQYPFRGAPFTALGVSYQQALANYLAGPLGGLVSSADYPEGGEGRITELP